MYSSLMPSFEGNLLTQRHQITSLETRGPYYQMVKTRSLYLTWAWFGTGSWHPRRTDRQTDRQTESSYALSAVPAGTAVARKNQWCRSVTLQVSSGVGNGEGLSPQCPPPQPINAVWSVVSSPSAGNRSDAFSTSCAEHFRRGNDKNVLLLDVIFNERIESFILAIALAIHNRTCPNIGDPPFLPQDWRPGDERNETMPGCVYTAWVSRKVPLCHCPYLREILTHFQNSSLAHNLH